ncbi:MAG TPA: hypothetical protein PKA58_33760 [Polyangium sp.]|nr:hypothetical protein [Polyangium sp.]
MSAYREQQRGGIGSWLHALETIHGGDVLRDSAEDLDDSSAFVFPRHIERLPSTPPPVGPVSVGWELGDRLMRPTVTVIESRPEGLLVRESLVGESALAWLRQHIPEALAEGAPQDGFTQFASMADIS